MRTHSQEPAQKNDDTSLCYLVDRDQFAPLTQFSESVEKKFGAPYSLCMELGQYCNFRCRICISDSGPTAVKCSDWVLPALANLHSTFGPLRIVWSGGEPTIYQDLAILLDKSATLGNSNTLVTNASRFVEGLSVDWIDISIYGYSEESFRKYTSSPLFKVCAKNTRLYANKYPRVSASFVLGVHGVHELKLLADFAVEAGIRRLKFHRLSRAGRIIDQRLEDSTEDEIHALREYLSMLPVDATFTRTKSSNQKRAGYFVAKPPGLLTNSEMAISLNEADQLREGVNKYSMLNRSLFSPSEA